MFKFLHAADIHLDSPLRGIARYEGMPVDDIRLAARHAFDHLVKVAIDEKVCVFRGMAIGVPGAWR